MYEPEPVKVVLLGETGVGKTSIISQFTTKKFNLRIPTSVSATFISKTIEFPEFEKAIKFDIWDTVGQEKYRSLAKIFYKDAKVIIFVYDITKQVTFDELKNYWLKETSDNVDGNPIIAVVANKIDKYEEQEVNNKDGKELADKIKAIFQTTSALSDSGINTLFENIGKKVIIPDYDYRNTDPQIQKDYIKKAQENKKEAKNKEKEEKIRLQKKDTTEIKESNKKKCC